MENQIVIYQTDNGQTSIDVRLESETVWLTQAQMAELFQKDQSVIARHIANVFNEGELEKNSNMQILHNTLSKYKPTAIYNLDVIISVGYRVKSQRGVQFRRWANRSFKRLTTMQCKPLQPYVRSLEVARCSVTRKTTRSKAASDRSIRLSTRRICIPVWRRRLPCCFISSRKTIHFRMETSESLQHYSCGFLTITGSFTVKMAANVLPTIRWLP